MDARLDPRKALGIDIGDAHVIANGKPNSVITDHSVAYTFATAGGSARDALRSLVISQQLLGTKEVHIVHHTDVRRTFVSCSRQCR